MAADFRRWAETETDPKKKVELISLANLNEGFGRYAHRREIEAKAKDGGVADGLICTGTAMRAGRWIASFRPQPRAITRAANDPRHGQFGHCRLTLGGEMAGEHSGGLRARLAPPKSPSTSKPNTSNSPYTSNSTHASNTPVMSNAIAPKAVATAPAPPTTPTPIAIAPAVTVAPTITVAPAVTVAGVTAARVIPVIIVIVPIRRGRRISIGDRRGIGVASRITRPTATTTSAIAIATSAIAIAPATGKGGRSE